MRSYPYTNAWIEGIYDGLEPRFSGLNNDKFRLKEIKLFASADSSQAGLFKDYRTVFDRSELSYLSVEVSFYNKLYKQNQFLTSLNWYARTILQCRKKSGNNWIDVCSFDLSRAIKSSEEIVRLNANWGNALQGSFWQEGEYYWDVWINDQLLVIQYFYINDIGLPANVNNAYFKEVVLQFYDSQKVNNGRYFKVFNKAKTIDIGLNVILYLNQHKPFFSEYFLDIYKDDQLFETTRSMAEYIYDLQPNDNNISFSFNRNSFREPGNWQEATYKYVLRFLGVNLLTANLEISNKDFEEGEFTSLIKSQLSFQGNDELNNGDVKIIMPSFNDSVQGGTILEWYKKEGEFVKKGELLVAISTVNMIVDLESHVEGIIKFKVPEGATVAINEKIATIENKKKSEDNKAITASNTALTTDDFLTEIDALIGMEDVKRNIRDHIKYIRFLQIRKQKGVDDNNPILLHSIFTGNPGTGKTTIIRLLGKIYHSMGLLSKGHVKEVDRADMVGEYIGSTAPKTKKEIEEARGGILFIDEAYSLARKGLSSNDFGKEVIEILLKEMTSNTGDLAIMCAGYPKEMNEFLEANPGLKSRFIHSYHFEDYTPDELLTIAEYTAEKNAIILAADAKKYLHEHLVKAYRDRDINFGNARFVNKIIQQAKMNLAKRLMNHEDITTLSNETLSTVQQEDIDLIFAGKDKKQYQPEIDEMLLEESLSKLNALIGIENIKQEINELIKLIRFYKETNKDILGKFSLHCVFTGNPGTGKTTVARIFSSLYKALGLLERGHLVEVDREALVAGYIGQTAMKTAEKIEQATGGILFIDEAYALLQKQVVTDFGNEAIQVILKRMEDRRGSFGIIVAGYTENMCEFIESNPGLQSRFDKTFHFPDYTPDQMFSIALLLLKQENLQIDDEASDYLKKHFQYIYQNRDKHFGNARKVRQDVIDIVKRQNLRMASLSIAQRDEKVMGTVIITDVQQFKTL